MPTMFRESIKIMDPISSGDSEFGRDEDLEVDTHLRSPARKTIYERALATHKERVKSDPIVWPSGARTMTGNSGNILFGDSLR